MNPLGSLYEVFAQHMARIKPSTHRRICKSEVLGAPYLDPALDGPEVEIIRREAGDERFKIQIDWSRI